MKKDLTPAGSVRLNKYIADCGIASRRKADELIENGQVMVNGKKVFELGTRIDPSQDRVTVSGKPVQASTEKYYLMFNKPKNVVTTMEDPEGRPTISDYLRRVPQRLFPVGRLDWDSEGMLLLTNDGEFAQKISHPKFEIPKTYMVKVSGQPTQQQLQKLLNGVSIIGGRAKAQHIEKVKRGADKYDWVKIIITEGKNRQIRQMFAKIGYDVIKLQRVAIGQLRLGKLRRGEFQVLSPNDMKRIFQVYVTPEEREEKQRPRALKRHGPRKSERIRTAAASKSKRPL